jgi:serine/threonine protein kinase
MRLYEVIDTRTHVHLVMELCHGKSLHHFVKKKKPDSRISEPEAAPIFRQIVSAVAYMHSLEIIHRDLKLDNVLINDQNEIKLIDFGFSSSCAPGEKLTSSCGTPQYMCPDLIKKSSSGHDGQASDVWAVGIILYLLVTGKLPFTAEFEADLTRRICAAKY